MFDAASFGTDYDDVDEYRKKFELSSGKPRERSHHAEEWLKNAIADKRIII